MKELIKKNILSKHIYQLCNRYVDFYRNDNNGNPSSNGEFELLLRHLVNPSKLGLVTQSSPVIFDIGAHVGEWTTFAHTSNREAIIHCFEPCSRTFSVLEKTLSNLSTHNITANHQALGSEPGKLEMVVYSETSALNSLYNRDVLGASIAREQVDINTLDSYCQNNDVLHINFCKLDVEGHELEVLKGAKQMLTRGAIDLIQFEYGGTYIDARILLKDVFEFFQSLPYQLFKILPHKIQPVSSYTVDLESFKYSNWVALVNRNSNLQ